jgi:putative transposase
MLEADAAALCGPRHGRGGGRQAQRWGRTVGPIGFHGGKVAVARPRVRERGGREVVLPSWERAVGEDWLGRWAMNLMLLGVTTRRFGRAVRLPEGDVPAGPGTGVSKSAASRRFVALSAERMAAWMAQDLSGLDLLALQIDGIHLAEDLVLLAAVGIDAEGAKHPLGLVEGATENAAVVQALLDDLVGRGLDPAVCRLFIVDGAKALTKAIRRTFGRDTPIQRCQIHTIRTQSHRGWAWAIAARLRVAQGDDMADLQATLADDDALDHQLQDRLLLGVGGIIETGADAGTERRQVGADRLRVGALLI